MVTYFYSLCIDVFLHYSFLHVKNLPSGITLFLFEIHTLFRIYFSRGLLGVNSFKFFFCLQVSLFSTFFPERSVCLFGIEIWINSDLLSPFLQFSGFLSLWCGVSDHYSCHPFAGICFFFVDFIKIYFVFVCHYAASLVCVCDWMCFYLFC